MPKYSFDNLILWTLHSLRQLIVLYARVPSQFWFSFSIFQEIRIGIQIRTDKNKNFQMGQDCSRLCNLEFGNWWKSKNFVSYIGSIPSLHFFQKFSICTQTSYFLWFKIFYLDIFVYCVMLTGYVICIS